MWRTATKIIIQPTNNRLTHLKYVVTMFRSHQKISIVKPQKWIITETVGLEKVENLLNTARKFDWQITTNK